MDIPLYSFHCDATPADQDAYVERVLAECDARHALFISWFCIVDYDALWHDVLGDDPVAKVWRDIGMYDESVVARPSLGTWEAWRAREKR